MAYKKLKKKIKKARLVVLTSIQKSVSHSGDQRLSFVFERQHGGWLPPFEDDLISDAELASEIIEFKSGPDRPGFRNREVIIK